MNRLEKGALAVAAVGLGVWLLGRLRKRYDFRDKSAVVTGGSRGLGLVLARQLTVAGARVAICARDLAELQRAADDLASHGARPSVHVCDLKDPVQVRAFLAEAERAQGPIDVLINNAGTIEVGPLRAMTRQDFEEAMAVNFWSAFNTIEAVLPGMRERQAGRIVNVSSIGGKISVPHLLPYSASKFALAGYSEGLRTELANNGVVVTTVFPGLMRTGSPPNAKFKGQHRAEYAWFSIGDALPLLTISAERAAAQILDACSLGKAEAVLTFPAQLAVLFHTLAPEWSADLLALVNRLLPRPGEAGTEAHAGRDSGSWLSPSWVTTLSDRATEQNNEGAAVRS